MSTSSTNFQVQNDKLLVLNHEIRQNEHKLEVAHLRGRRSNIALALGPLLAVILYGMWWLAPLPKVAIYAIYGPTVPLAIAFCVASYYLRRFPGYPEDGFGKSGILEGELELDISRLRDERKILLASIDTPFKVRRVGYKEDAFSDIDRLRGESGRYRRVSNFLQGTLIVGSLAATGVAGIIGQYPLLRWVILCLTFVVGLASGFGGYFKYKERSFYLQQTADAIEGEWEAVDIGVGRYKRMDEEGALAEFVEEVHRLKSEQRKRQQNLEQPPDARTSSE